MAFPKKMSNLNFSIASSAFWGIYVHLRFLIKVLNDHYHILIILFIKYINEKYSPKNIVYFFNALEGPNGEKVFYTKIDTCCPFPSKKSIMGAGTLEVYIITFEGSDARLTLYLNIYEKGKVVCPKGLKIKKYIQE